jgi:hypothetical protein
MPADRLLHPRLGHSAKVGALTHLEFRVWITYQLASDDYGVMRKSAVTLQAADDALAREKPAVVLNALKRLTACGLIKKFDHQGRTYVFQSDWQNFQRVKHPRDTMQPLPPDEMISACTPATRKLFAQHPSKNPKDSENDLGNISETLPQDSGIVAEVVGEPLSENGSLARARTRETANGYRPPANGNKGVQGDSPPMDRWLHEVQHELYPSQRVTRDVATMQAFVDAMNGFVSGPWAAWDVFKTNLAGNVQSHEWRHKGMVPRLEKYIRTGQWQNAPLPANAPVSEQLTAKTNRTLDAAARILRESA